jgi:ElaB/YqjD/DUF883 family membrane-anchored ribosome-binding protein
MTDTTALEQNRIEDNLERARSRMDARLSELQERLSPGQVLDDLMAYFRGSEGAEFGRSLLDSVKSNPLPAALTGIGLTWLMAANQHPQPATNEKLASTGVRTSWRTIGEFDEHLRTAEAAVVRRTEDDDVIYRERLDEARAKALGVTRTADESSQSFGQRVQDAISATQGSLSQAAQGLGDKASAVKETVTAAVGQATNQVGGMVHDAGDKVSSGVQTIQQMSNNLFATMGDNPILLGGVGLMVGALLGSLVPQSEAEEEALSDLAGTVRSTATVLAQQVVDRGSESAGKLVEGVRDSAEAQGLSGDMSITDVVKKAGSGELLSSAKDVAHDVLKAGEEAVRGEGSPQTSSSPQSGAQGAGSAQSGSPHPSAGSPPEGSSWPSPARQAGPGPKSPGE